MRAEQLWTFGTALCAETPAIAADEPTEIVTTKPETRKGKKSNDLDDDIQGEWEFKLFALAAPARAERKAHKAAAYYEC
jgi:hypothetical protein